jgi:hypothetical protein
MSLLPPSFFSPVHTPARRAMMVLNSRMDGWMDEGRDGWMAAVLMMIFGRERKIMAAE